MPELFELILHSFIVPIAILVVCNSMSVKLSCIQYYIRMHFLIEQSSFFVKILLCKIYYSKIVNFTELLVHVYLYVYFQKILRDGSACVLFSRHYL